MSERDTFPILPDSRPNAPVVIWLLGLTALPEILFTLTSREIIPGTGLREWALLHGAFWRGLLLDWEPLYAGQREAMFLTHAFLHGGLLHLVGNMVVVAALGGIVVARLGQGGFVLLYAVTAIGGGAAFGLISDSTAPMVGASGAVFGLFGAWKYWEFRARRAAGAPLGPLVKFVIGLVVLNVLLWAALSGLVAWEAHLGGFIAGWAWAALVTPRDRYRLD